jgi:hypothetical protein
MPGGVWGLAITLLPGAISIVVGHVLAFRARETTAVARGARLITIGWTLSTLIPGTALIALVLIGEAQPTALIAAAFMIGLAALRWTVRVA